MRKRQEEKAKESAKALRNILSKIKLSKYNLEIIKNKDGVISFIETIKDMENKLKSTQFKNLDQEKEYLFYKQSIHMKNELIRNINKDEK